MLHSQKSIEKILSDIERDVKQDLDYNTKRSSIWELHQSAPESLKQRLVKILPLELFLGDESFEEDATKMKTIEPDLQAEIEKRIPTLDNILEERDIDVDSAFELMSRAYQEVRLRSAESGSESHQRFKEKKVNWIAEYVKKLRRHRVQWDSKLYRDAAKNWHKKSMIENVEAMIDLSATEFADWCNSLSSNKAGEVDKAQTVTPELIKQLFSIETEGSAPRGLYVEPTDLHIIPAAVTQFAQGHNSQLDLEWKMNKLRRRDEWENARPEKEHAFGRSLPKELKQKRRHGMTKDMKPVFPDDLRTKEVLFKGIEHLHVTRSMFEQKDALPLPDYLRKNSLFNRSRTIQKDE